MIYLISYDIQDDAIRTKVAKTLLRYGLHRVQYSVYMGELRESTLTKVEKKLNEYTQLSTWSMEDSIMVMPLHQYSEDNVQFIGASPDRWLEITGTIHTLIL